ncbi:MAG: NADP(H)-dependent aldo-keto reductase [Methylococcaceae bacterium]|nr:NADP(H)-dependent aldo-keto reductase [Methylococcaceae bacterium]
MRYHELGRTGVKVSELCLGTMTFGQQNTESQGFEQLDRALAAGINFIDTAEMYPIPPSAKTYGRTETIIGNWLRKKGCRNDVILATKVIGRGDWMRHIRGGKSRPDRDNILQALEGSLSRLQTDYIDLYQIHWPARETNYFGRLGYTPAEDEQIVSIESTLRALAEVVAAGKVRFVGVSNETPWGVMQYLYCSERSNLPRIVSIQNPYNLLNRSFEVGLAEIAHREKVGLLAYSPLAFGTLSGKYLDGKPGNARLTLYPDYARYTKSEGVAATRAYVDLARDLGLSPAQMALAYINSRPFLTSNIIGATTLDQLDENLGSVNLRLDDDAVRGIETIHQRISNPCP